MIFSVRRLLAVVLALSFAALAPALAQTKVETVRFADVPLQDWLPFWVLEQKDIGTKFGIMLESVPITGGTQTAEFIATGHADVTSVAATLSLLAVKQGLVPNKVVLVSPLGNYADPTHPLSGVIVSDTIKTWKDLEGKRVAIHNLRSMLYMTLKMRLQKEGVDIDKIDFVEIPLQQQETLLKAGRVQAVVLGTEFSSRAIVHGTGRLLGWVVGEPPFDDYTLAYLVASREFVDKKPQVFNAFLKSYISAINWILQNPDEAKNVAAKKLGITDPVVIAKFTLGRWDPSLSVSAQSTLLDFEMLKAEKLLTEPIDITKHLTGAGAVAAAKKELGIGN